MSVFKHKNGYYGYSFMYQGKRYCKTFKGMEKDDVAKLETVHRSELIKTGYDITEKRQVYLSELINDLKAYSSAHHSRPNERDYVLDDFLKLTGDKIAQQVTPYDIEKYIKYRIGKVKNSTINRDFDTVYRIFSLGIDNEKIEKNPCKKVKKLRVEHPPERYLTKDEEIKLLAVCNPIMRVIVITALHTGMRQNEILSLKWEDLFFNEGYLIARNTKNNKPRKLLLTDTLQQELKTLPKLSEYVFTSPVTNSRYTQVKCTFRRAVKRAGIPHICFHQLRHTTASRLNEKGVDIVTIQTILDHAELRTTQRYTHGASASIINAFNLLNNY